MWFDSKNKTNGGNWFSEQDQDQHHDQDQNLSQNQIVIFPLFRIIIFIGICLILVIVQVKEVKTGATALDLRAPFLFNWNSQKQKNYTLLPSLSPAKSNFAFCLLKPL